jgi:hypothetical protein
MKGEISKIKAHLPLHRILISLLLVILILSSVPVVIALNPIPMSNSKMIRGYELRAEDSFNRLIPEIDIPLDNQKIVTPSSILIKMKAAEFDPLIEEPDLPLDLLYNLENGYYLVQFNGLIQSYWVEEIRAAGAFILGYVPDHTYLLHMDDKTKERLEKLPFVRWIGIFHPAYKIQGGLLDNMGEIELNVLVLEEKQENLEKVRKSITALGGTITYNGEDNHIIRTKIAASKIRNIAFIPEVEWIDEYSPPTKSMNNIRGFTGTNFVHLEGFNGSGIVGEVKDDGFDPDHPDFDGQILATDGNPPDDAHGTCAFGIVFSLGENKEQAKGLLPGAKGVFCAWQVPTTTSISNLVNNWDGVFQSNSWSSGDHDGLYTLISYENDDAVFDYDVVILRSSGNDGTTPGTCSQDSVAKNVIGVGALWHKDNSFRTDDEWANFGPNATPAQGPAADGRIKPDLSGPFDFIYTTDSVDGDGQNGYVAGNYYDNFGGTSGATPVVAGAVGLVYQMYKEDHFGNNPSGNLPNASAVKAILIADAYQYEFSQANRYQQGWGGVDVGKVYNVGKNHFIIDESKPLYTGQSATYAIVPTGGGPLKISLVWTDVPATPGANPALVNNLNLRITDPGGIVYWGNYGLNTSKWSSSGGSADLLNNVENVFIQNPTPGVWTIEVIGQNVPLDGEPSTPGWDQSFALVASNAVESLVVKIAQPSSGQFVKDIFPIIGTASPDIIRVEVKIDNGLWENATGTINWYLYWDTSSLSDGIHTIYAKGTNYTIYSDIKSVEVIVDNTPPTTSTIVGDPKHQNGSTWVVLPSTQFTINAIDNGSGANTTWYRILYEGTEVIGWTEGNIFTLSWGEGNYSIEYYSNDDLGNTDIINSTAAYVDLSPPITELDIGQPKYRDDPINDHWNVTTATIFNLLVMDEKSKVSFGWYTIDGTYFLGGNFDLMVYSEGMHNITWGGEDHFGHNESGNSISVVLDRRAPTTDLEIGGPKSQRYTFEPWNVTTETPFTITASDLLSGVAFSWYTIDGQFFKGSNFNLSGHSEGLHTIAYGSQDNVGQNDTVEPFYVVLDLGPPNTTLVIGEPKSWVDDGNYWSVAKTTSFKLLAYDKHAGVVTTWFTIDEIYYEGDEFNLATLPDGLHSITWGSIDNLTQNETGNSLTVNLDSQPPITNMTLDGPKYMNMTGDSWDITQSTLFTLSPYDTNSGIKLRWYTIDSIYFEGISFNLTGYEEGYHTITWGSMDNVGNNETGNVMMVYLNIVPHITTLDIGEPKNGPTTENYWYVTDDTLITLSPSITHPGINFTWYTIDGNYFEGMIFDLSGYEEGLHTITWGSEDNLILNETGNSVTVILDIFSPNTGINIGDPKYHEDIEDFWWVNGVTIFTFTPLDNCSGVAFTWYEIDDDYFIGSSFTLSEHSDGQHEIAWGSQDNLGHNETEHIVIVNLDNTPPSISIHIGEPKSSFRDLTYINSSTLITLIYEDTGVDESKLYYSFDGGTIYYNYELPFSVPSKTTSIIYGGEDLLENRRSESIINVIVDNSDTDRDGIDNLVDEDDDGDGLPDDEEDSNQNGILDLGETDPLNPDTDGDGYWDGIDAYPLDKDRWDGEGNDNNILLMILLVLAMALILILLFIFRQRKDGGAKVEWGDEDETLFEPHEEQIEWTDEDEILFEPHEEQVDWTDEHKTRFRTDK